MKILCSVSNNTLNTGSGSPDKTVQKTTPTIYNSIYMSKLSHQKMKAIAALDVQIYKAFERKHKNDDEMIMRLNDICDTIEIIHEINKKNNLYKLFDDKIIPLD
jgi:hypothetical protein